MTPCWLIHNPDDPWDWNIYLHEWPKFMVNVGKYPIHGAFGQGFVCFTWTTYPVRKAQKLKRIVRHMQTPTGNSNGLLESEVGPKLY